MFVDEVKVHVKGGRGGNGVTSFARQPFEPRGRPDGGDGGHGGSVVLRATTDVATLVDYHHRPHRSAGHGRHGEGDLRRGADGEDTVLLVPVGTVVADVGTDGAGGEVLADLRAPGQEHVVARGGRGGRGNAAFRTAQRRAPRFHERGEPPQERWVRLELKLVTDVALVGFPNAGKSSLIARLSAARPKIAGYPFTTLSPNLGVVTVDDLDLVVADVPGLIEGASEGRGLGQRFLRHVELASVLVHVLDCASYEQRDPRQDLATVLTELQRYDAQVDHPAGGSQGGSGPPLPWEPLVDRPAVVFANKADADPDVAELVRMELAAEGWDVVVGSAVTGQGLDELRHRLAVLVAEARRSRAAEPLDLGARPVLRPAAAGGQDFTVERTGFGWRVSGERVERWVVMTDTDNDDAVRYLQGRLARAGVEKQLAAAGARRGDAVEIAGLVFDFLPEAGVVDDDDLDDLDGFDEGDGLDDAPGAGAP